MTTIALIGAGHIGSQVARLAVSHGYNVVVSNSRGPETLAGFDTVDAGALKEGWRIQRDTPGYGPRRNAEELKRDLAAAKRYRDM
jgi:predicted dinucleotide-binding enzyme